VNTKIGALVCALAGHRWTIDEHAETHAGLVIIRCDRCRSESIVSSDTFQAEGFADRAMRASVSESPIFDPRDIDPRIRERRR
jgi:hypothetical protein